VFYNNNLVCFIDKFDTIKTENFNQVLEYSNGFNFKKIKTDLIKSKDIKFLIICQKPEEVLDFFKQYFRVIHAAGGIVKNDKDEVLLIYKSGKWDLPKGKIESEEHVKEAAKREVIEETGIKKVKILSELSQTYHIYKLKKEYVLKISHWFEMKSDFKGKFVPQKEENITEVKWINISEAMNLNNTYETIKDLLNYRFNTPLIN
ncbi:MAG: NUDIX hydrolase, partial [Bacteroidota bacterium]|nr:NUDIX hydrolase [Bacteroidota bacterium]